MDQWEYMNLTIAHADWMLAMKEAGDTGWEAWAIRDTTSEQHRVVHFKRKLRQE